MTGYFRGQNKANPDPIQEKWEQNNQLQAVHEQTGDKEHQSIVAELKCARSELARAQHELVLAQETLTTPLQLWNCLLHVLLCNCDTRKDQSKAARDAETPGSSSVKSIQRRLLSQRLHATCAPSTKNHLS